MMGALVRLLFLTLATMLLNGKADNDDSDGGCDSNSIVLVANVTEGEDLRLEQSRLESNDEDLPNFEFAWYRNDSQDNYSSSEEERIHHHGHVLYLFNLSLDDSGLYCTRMNFSDECYIDCMRVNVFPASQPVGKERLLHPITESATNPEISCPDLVEHICRVENGNITWYRNFTLIPDEHGKDLRVKDATERDKGVYTCLCTWTHNHRQCRTPAYRELNITEPNILHKPNINSPKPNSTYPVYQGSSMTLNCSAYCGQNIKHSCKVMWRISNKDICGRMKREGYFCNLTSETEKHTKRTIFTAALNIEKVSADDFQSEFQCLATNNREVEKVVVFLRPRESLQPYIIGGLCVLLLCVLAAAAVKYFSVDLLLFFRRFYPFYGYHDDGKVYDAYVIYQMQREDEDLNDTLCHFITTVLPSVLEVKCGFRIFIHGRDDLPGEDCLELAERRIRQSRRLMVILTPGATAGSGSEVTKPLSAPVCPPTNTGGVGYDWQTSSLPCVSPDLNPLSVGLHQALVQSEMSVILIQLGKSNSEDYSHLPLGLQHLVQKSAPLRWQLGLRGADTPNSRFWKRVRYMMPAVPVTSKFIFEV